MLIVSSFVMPPMKTGLIDRFLVMAAVEKIDPAILFHKADLLGSPAEGMDILARYRSLGYRAYMTSTVSGEGIEVVRNLVQGRISLLAGHSGVGKSSLLNTLRPGIGEEVEVREVSTATGKGRHTTTSIRLYTLDGSTRIIDLPGVKLASLHGLTPHEIAGFFPEFASRSSSCRYRDCLHLEEPQCSVKGGVREGVISLERYESYRRMVMNPEAGT